MPLTIATIALDRPDHARGRVVLTGTPRGVEITVETPDGVEDPGLGIAPDDATATAWVYETWGRGPWDLRWEPV